MGREVVCQDCGQYFVTYKQRKLPCWCKVCRRKPEHHREAVMGFIRSHKGWKVVEKGAKIHESSSDQ